jgi:hypothetical protein
VVASPWNDQISAQYSPHPSLAAIERIQAWKADPASGLRPSFKAIAKHEGLTVARVSQMMVLSRLTQPALDRLGEILAKPMAAKEAFSLRKLFQVARLPGEAQESRIDQMAHQSRLRRLTNSGLLRSCVRK